MLCISHYIYILGCYTNTGAGYIAAMGQFLSNSKEEPSGKASTYGIGDVIGLLVDADKKKLYMFKNRIFQGN